MADNSRDKLLEEEIRAKVVYTWLVDHGFDLADIKPELTFQIRLGRNVFRVESRQEVLPSRSVAIAHADVLVRRISDGKNLLIVEVKAPGESLDENAKEQGISYARLLKEGGIAPFVILTNGFETKIYDSISEEQIEGTSIPLDHPHIKSGFQVSTDDITLRAEALEKFISLSPENFIKFCRLQTKHHMQLLRSNDPFSGKKYIPQLYIERQKPKEELQRLIDQMERKVVVLIGRPQVGKTNFVCHTVEEWLNQQMPCLFYPAIGMGKSLLNAICEDFEWIIGDASSPYNIVHNKLSHVLRRAGTKLAIFIDGWNEADLDLARAIDREGARLSDYDITIVISMTNLAARRLLLDNVGNPSYVAEAAGINSSAVPLLEINPEQNINGWSKIYIDKFSLEERQRAYIEYAKVFNVNVPYEEHQFVDDPFLLRIGMEAFQGQKFPQVLDEPGLLRQSIEKKAMRAIDLRDKNIPLLLRQLAVQMLKLGAPLSQSVVMCAWGLPSVQEPPRGLFEAALLVKGCDQQGLPTLDFYSSREKDFSVAYWALNWPSELKDLSEALLTEVSFDSEMELTKAFLTEVSRASKTEVGLSALEWFMKQPAHEAYLKICIDNIHLFEKSQVKIILLSALFSACCRKHEADGSFRDIEDWVELAIDKGTSDEDMLVRVEAAKLMPFLMEGPEEIVSVIEEDSHGNLRDIIIKLLNIDEEYPLKMDSVGRVILGVFELLHMNLGGQDDWDGPVAETLIQLTKHEKLAIRKSASKVLGFIDPDMFLRWMRQFILSHQERISAAKLKEFCEAIELVEQVLEETYNGSPMQRGYLARLYEVPEQLCEEYATMYSLCAPIIATYSSMQCGKGLLKLLEDLQPNESLLESHGLPSTRQILDEYSYLTLIFSPYRQLSLFPDENFFRL